VGSTEVADESLRQADLGANSVDSPELDTASVSSSELATGSVFAAEIADGSLNGDDVAHESGRFQFDPPAISPTDCSFFDAATGIDEDFSDDLILAMAPTAATPRISIHTLGSVSRGTIRLQVCNHEPNLPSNPGPVTVRWIAFDV
jgi:hypothetical protein